MKRLTIIGLWPDDVVKYCTEKCDCRRYAFDRILYHRGGRDAQLTKAVEEMSELTKALCKLKECKRKYDTPFNRETQEVYYNIEEETADVFIMLVQLFAIFNPHEPVNITKIVWDKLDRLKDNLDKEAAKQEGCKDDTPEC